MNAFSRKLYSIIKRVEVWHVVVPSHAAQTRSYLILVFCLGYKIVEVASDVKSTIPHNTGRDFSMCTGAACNNVLLTLTSAHPTDMPILPCRRRNQGIQGETTKENKSLLQTTNGIPP